MAEGEYLSDIGVDSEVEDMMREKAEDRYELNDQIIVGEKITCPICLFRFTKREEGQVFCGTNCENHYFDMVGDYNRIGTQFYREKKIRKKKKKVVDIVLMIERYDNNKKAKVGDTIHCPTCGKVFEKRSYQNVFCGKRGVGKQELKGRLCKDTYWNTVDKKRRERACKYR